MIVTNEEFNDLCPYCGGEKSEGRACCLTENFTRTTSIVGRKMREVEEGLIPILLEYAHEFYGAEAIVEAWDSFTLNEQVPMDPESQLELESLFIPWFVFNWVADRSDDGKVSCYPEEPIALDYLRKKGIGLDDFSHRFIELSCSQPYRFFAVKQVVERRQLVLEDVLLGQEVIVDEPQASEALAVGSFLYAGIVSMDNVTIMLACAPMIIPARFESEFVELRVELEEAFPSFDEATLLKFDLELRALYYDIRDELYS